MTMDQHVADLNVVLDEPAHLIGWSWGAMLALSFTSIHPKFVRSIVLVGCGTYDADTRAKYSAAMAAGTTDAVKQRVANLDSSMKQATDTSERNRLFAAIGHAADMAQTSNTMASPIDHELEADALGYDETWADVLRLQADGIEPQRFASITQPVLMLHGADDPHPGSAIRETLRQYIPGLEYKELPNAGHKPWLERTARDHFLATLNAWLEPHF